MRKTKIHFFALASAAILLSTLVTEESQAIHRIDGDTPGGFEAGVGSVVARGYYRFISGHLGTEITLTFDDADAQFDDFFDERGLDDSDADALFLDWSLVWYANYNRLYRANQSEMTVRQKIKRWQERAVKPELLAYAGPGVAQLRVGDLVSGFDATREFFTLHAGIGVNLHWFNRGEEHQTSRVYVRPDLRARWIDGGDDDIELHFSVTVGYGVGKRQTVRALELRVDDACGDVSLFDSEARQFVVKRMEPAARIEQLDEMCETAIDYRHHVEQLKSQVVHCGSRCEQLRGRIDDCLETVNDSYSILHKERQVVDEVE